MLQIIDSTGITMSEELFINSLSQTDSNGNKTIINELFEVTTSNATIAFKISSLDPAMGGRINRYLRGYYYQHVLSQTEDLEV